VKGIVLNTRDITERKEFEEQLQHQAFHDPVTNLANRALFRDRVLHAIERQERDRKPIAVLFMDIDDFKTVNDSLGHAAGDGLLLEVGDRLKKALRAADTAARLGGDEFAILLEDGGEGIQAADVADRIMQMLEEPFTLEGKEVFVRASVGIAVSEEAGDGGEEVAEALMRNADVAMYMAKANGKAGFAIFDPGMHAAIRDRHELATQLQSAVELGQLRLVYQPIVSLKTRQPAGLEALVPAHPDREWSRRVTSSDRRGERRDPPPVGRWVLAEACRDAARWGLDRSALFLCVNVSAREIGGLRPRSSDAGRGRAAGPTPASRSRDPLLKATPSTIATLEGLRKPGVPVVIGDFGTGYFSLAHLRQFQWTR
jgi:diguanylate cyclase (GGDEF)-like protein